ncbi:hypothetical protein B0F90DRAFT_1819254 [Multifurca ochricompacta]|uniref:Uncharacterized protein n=1 Tax=Multifurca ochricompacta TaxID=376703 RepID=A0AAD4QLX1_9AGAM|nr:hypothetical protein B0F90DRAFT_1819254 [Multifurca ochricompacta]
MHEIVIRARTERDWETTVIVFKIFGIERAWQNQGSVGPRPRQLFITKSRLLAEKVEQEYINLLFSLSADRETPQYVRAHVERWNSRRKMSIFDQNDADDKRNDLPETFSQLNDSYFPLFITMDTLYSLLEAETKPPPQSQHLSSFKGNSQWLGRTNLVTYEVFKREYWRQIPRHLVKVFLTEISLANKGLRRDSYNLDYSIFEVYQQLRSERDLADSYVDEVQDMLLIDTRVCYFAIWPSNGGVLIPIIVILSLCRNPSGFLWAGDTAQTISIGSAFTFKQLGTSVYKYQRSIQSPRGTPRKPERFQLLVNYRSQGGIMNCANAIIQLLRLFPGAIDALRPEAGIPSKELPKFFKYLPTEERNFFLLPSGKLSQLGHSQCVIVRDEAAHQKFKKDIGLDVIDSKGLEYDDVILYNSLRISDLRYAPLVHELKSLYVAISRARHRLWIVDYSNVCRPIRQYLLDRGLVVESSDAGDPIESFVNQSTAEEWADDGHMVAVATAYQSQKIARDIPESETSADRRLHERRHPIRKLIKSHQGAVRNLKLAGLFTEAASYCFDNNILEEAVSIIKKHEAEVDSHTIEHIKRVAQISYLQQDREMEALDLALEHTDEVTRDVQVFHAVAPDSYGDIFHSGVADGRQRGASSKRKKILMLLERIPREHLNDEDRRWRAGLFFYFDRSTDLYVQLDIFKLITLEVSLDRSIKLLALDYFFDDIPRLWMYPRSRELSHFANFYEYSLLIKDAALDKAPWESAWLCTLFQFEMDGEGIRIRPETLIYEFINSQPEEYQGYPLVSLSREAFSFNLRRLLSERLHCRIKEKDRVTLHLRLFDPCIWSTLGSTCSGDHSATHQIDESWFNRRILFYLQHIMILDNHYVFSLTDFPVRIRNQRRLLSSLENALNPLLHLSGSIAALNEDLIPEAKNGFSTVKRWSFDILYKLNPSREELQGDFLTNLYKAFTLGRLRQDGRTVDDCLRCIPSTHLRKQPHPRLIISCPQGFRVYTLHDFLAFIDGSGNLMQGVKFFGYLVRERIPVDPAVLCAIVERLFGLIIMTESYRESLPSVLLPRSWILTLWQDFIKLKERAVPQLCVLALETENLLKDIYTGDYLSRTIIDSKNFNPTDLANKAFNCSRDLPLWCLRDLCVTRLYTNSQRWPELAEALYQSTSSPFDHLVRLRLDGSAIIGPQPPGVHLTTLKELNVIPDVTQPRPIYGQIHTAMADLRGNAGAFEKAANGHKLITGGIDVGLTYPVAANTRRARKTAEALIIQRAVRRYILKHLEGNSKDTVTIGRGRLFKACKASVTKVHARYRKIYLGPVPHLLLCVQWIASHVQASKNAIKVRRAEATLQELSDLAVQQTEINAILREARELQASLKPGSTKHPRKDLGSRWDATRDLEPIRSATMKTKELLGRLSCGPEVPTTSSNSPGMALCLKGYRKRKRTDRRMDKGGTDSGKRKW